MIFSWTISNIFSRLKASRKSVELFSNTYTLKCSQPISSSNNDKILLTTRNVRLVSGHYATKYYCGLLASKESQVLVQHSVHCLQLPFCPHNVVSFRAVGMSEILGGVGGVYLYRGKHLSSMVPGGQKSWGTMALSPSPPCLTVTKSHK